MKRGISFGIIATICLLFITNLHAGSKRFSTVYQLFDCGQVENLTASIIGHNYATIQWEDAPGAVSYNLRLATDGQETTINIIEGNSFTFENLSPSTSYTVTVTAMCLLEGGLVSSILSVQYTFITEPEPTPSCGVPSKPAINNITANSASVSWLPDPNAIGYTLMYYTRESNPIQITLEGTALELQFLYPNTEYTVEIFSICNIDSIPTQNDQGTTITFTTQGEEPVCQLNAYESNNSIPTATRMSIDKTGVNAMIEAPKGETKDLDYFSFITPQRGSFLVAILKNLTKDYNLSIFNAEGILQFSSKNGGTSNEVISFRFLSNQTYYALVEPASFSDYDERGCYNLSVQESSSLACDAPSGLIANNITLTQANLTWSNIALAIQYRLSYRIAGTSPWTDILTASNSALVTGLQPNTTYEWKIKSICSADSSNFSGISTFNTTPVNIGCIDNYEVNNQISQPMPFMPMFTDFQAKLDPNSDVDFFKFYNPYPAANITVTLKNLPSNYDLRLYRNQIPVDTSETAGLANETVTFTATSTDTFRIRVYKGNGGVGSTSCYTLNGQITPISCNIPTNLVTSNPTINGFTVNWTAVPGVSYYLLEYKTPQGNWTPVAPNPTTNTFTFTTLNPNTTYQLRVKACCTNNLCSDWSAVINASTSSCGIPQNVAHANVTTNSFTLSWNPVTSATGYIVEYRTINGTWNQLPVTTNTSINITPLQSGVTYEYRVKAICSPTISGDFSAIGTVTTISLNCDMPTGLTSSNTTLTGFTISWNSVANVSYYVVEYKASTASTWIPLPNQTTTTYTFTNLLPNTTYNVHVKACCSNNVCSNFTSDINVTTANCVVPQNVNHTNVTTNSFTVTWTAVPLATSYIVEYKSTGNWTPLPATTNTSINITNLMANTAYQYRVKANCSPTISGDYSTVGNVTTLPYSACPIPIGLNATNIQQNSAQLIWDIVSGVIGYNLEWRPQGGTWMSIIVNGASNNTYLLTGLASGSNYEFRLRAVCITSLSDYSVTFPFTTLGGATCNTTTLNATTNITSTTATINWTAVSGAISYNIQYRIQGSTNWLTTTSTTNSKNLINLDPGKTYEFQVQTVCASATSNFTNSATFSTPAIATCGTTSSITISNITNNQATVSWTAVPNATSYIVEYRIFGQSWQNITSTTTNATLTALTANKTYEVRIIAVCTSGNGTPSLSQFFATTQTNTTCTDTEEPNNQVGDPMPTIPIWQDYKARLNPNSDVDFFQFENPFANATIKVTLSQLPSNYDLRLYRISTQVAEQATQGLVDEVITYNNADANLYKIRVFKGTGGAGSTTCYNLKVEISLPPCGVASGLNVTDLSQTSAKLQWTAVPNVSYYNISYNKIGETPIVITSNTNFVVVSNLIANTNYEFKVEAICPNGSNGYSTPFLFSTLAQSCNDTYEANETQATAAQIDINTDIFAKLFPTPPAATDVDFFKFTNPLPNATIVITLSDLPSNYDLRLYKQGGTQVAESALPGNVNEIITYPNAAAGEYKIRVIKGTNGQFSPNCYKLFVYIDLPDCGDVTGLSATQITQTTATLNWTAVPGAISYNVQWRIVGTTQWSTGTATTNSLPISGLTGNSTYEFQVQSVCTSGNGNFSPSATFLTTSANGCNDTYEPNETQATAAQITINTNIQARLFPTPPDNTDVDFFKFTNPSANTTIVVTLSNLPSNYDLRLYKPGGVQVGESTNTGTLNETITYNNADAGEYKVRVIKVTGAQFSQDCYTLNVNINLPNCGDVNGLNATLITQTTATLNWTAVPNAIGYNVQWRKIGTTQWSTGSATTNSLPITGLTAGTNYEFQVQSICTAGNGNFSPSATFNTVSISGCSDTYEDNNNSADAKLIPVGTPIQALIDVNSDVDWYYFDNSLLASSIQVSLTNLPKNYNVSLHKGSQLDISENSGTLNEFIDYPTSDIGTYRVKVFRDPNCTNQCFSATECYTLKVDLYSATCTPPSGLNVTQITQNTATLNWNAVSSAVGYIVQYRRIGTINWVGPLPTTTNSLPIDALLPDSTYEFQVKSVCGSEESNFSLLDTFTTAGWASCINSLEPNNGQAAAIAIPLNTEIKSMIQTGNDQDWFSFSSAVGQTYVKISLTNLPKNYNVFLYRKLPGTPLEQVGSGTNPGTANEQIILATSWQADYFVKIVGDNVNYSDVECYTLKAEIYNGPPICEAPVNVTVSEVTAISAKICWQPVPNALFYYIRWINNSLPIGFFHYDTISGPNPDTCIVITGLIPKKNYTVEVKADCGFNIGNYGSINFSTPNAAICSQNSFENNNQQGNAFPYNLAVPTIESMIEDPNDVDWFSFSNTSSQRTIRVTLSGMPSNYDIELYKTTPSGGVSLVASSTNSGITDELIDYQPPFSDPVGEYKVKIITPFGGWNNADCYTLGISIYNKPYVCTAPTGLNATNITQTSAQLNWNAVPDAQSYTLQYKINIPFITNWTTVSNITTNSFVVTGLIPSISYVYRVRTSCVFGSSSSNSVNANFSTKQPGDCVQNAYENNNQSANATNFIFFGTDVKAMIEVGSDNDWYKFTTDLTNPYIKINLTTLPQNYQLELYKANAAGNPGSTPVATSYNSGTTSEFIDFNGPQATVGTYFVKVFSEGSAKDTVNCYTLNIIKYPAPPTCDAPTGLTVDNITPISAKLMWDGDVDATIYYVRYRKVGTLTWTEQQVFAPISELIITGLTEQTNYEFQVKSYCDFGESQYSSIGTFSTPLVGCAFTIYEPNNGPPNAKAITPGVEIQAMIEEAGDLDVYSFSTTSANPHCKIYLTSLPKDYDIYLFKQGPAGGWGAVFPDNPVAYSKKDGVQNEYIEYQSTTATNYMVAVGPKNTQSFSPFECYNLKVDLWNGPINCATPQNIIIQNITTTTIAISWNPVPNTLGYDVYYKRSFGQTGWDVASSTDTSILITGLWHSTNYTFKVRSKCVQTLASPFSNEQTFKTLTLEDCGIYNYEPNETQEQALQNNPIVSSPAFGNPPTTHKAMIEHPQDEDYYSFYVEIKEDDGDLLIPYLVITLTNLPKDYNLYLYAPGGGLIDSSVNSGIEDDIIMLNIFGIFPGIQWPPLKVRVSPRSSEAGGNPLNWDTTQCYHLSIHSYYYGDNFCSGVNLKPVGNLTETTAIINWNTKPNVSTYEVEYKLSTSSQWTSAGFTTATSFTITGLQQNKTYNYRVRPQFVAGLFPDCTPPWANGTFHTPYPCTDINEVNNTQNTAKVLTDNFPLNASFSNSNDEDWYFLYNSLFGNPEDEYLEITVSAIDYPGTVNLELYNDLGNVVATGYNNTLYHSVTVPNGNTPGFAVKATGMIPNYCYQISSQCQWWDFQRVINIPPVSEDDPLLLNVFPNPTNGIIQVKVNAKSDEELTIVIHDLSGKPIINDKVQSGFGETLKSYDLSNLSNGMYFIKVSDRNKSKTAKISLNK